MSTPEGSHSRTRLCAAVAELGYMRPSRTCGLSRASRFFCLKAQLAHEVPPGGRDLLLRRVEVVEVEDVVGLAIVEDDAPGDDIHGPDFLLPVIHLEDRAVHPRQRVVPG